MFPLSGCSIGLTGGGGHLGQALALGLAAAGANVMICGRSREPLEAVLVQASESRLAGSLALEVADVSSEAETERLLDALEERFGPVNGWVNNAFGGEASRLESLSRSAVERTVGSALVDVMMTTDCVIKRMRDRGGAIVNIASMYGMVSPDPAAYKHHESFHNPPAYGAAKAGLIQYTRYAACHLATRGIRVNAVSPGPFPGPEVQREERFVDALAERVPLGRIGQPQELVGPVAFLLSTASSFVTGHNLVVDGGWTAW